MIPNFLSSDDAHKFHKAVLALIRGNEQFATCAVVGDVARGRPYLGVLHPPRMTQNVVAALTDVCPNDLPPLAANTAIIGSQAVIFWPAVEALGEDLPHPIRVPFDESSLRAAAPIAVDFEASVYILPACQAFEDEPSEAELMKALSRRVLADTKSIGLALVERPTERLPTHAAHRFYEMFILLSDGTRTAISSVAAPILMIEHSYRGITAFVTSRDAAPTLEAAFLLVGIHRPAKAALC